MSCAVKSDVLLHARHPGNIFQVAVRGLVGKHGEYFPVFLPFRSVAFEAVQYLLRRRQ